MNIYLGLSLFLCITLFAYFSVEHEYKLANWALTAAFVQLMFLIVYLLRSKKNNYIKHKKD